jgi:hypothetical protein
MQPAAIDALAMDPQWQPHLDHPPGPVPITHEARGLFAAGWHASADECRIVNLADQTQQLVSPQTWSALRELGASVPAHLSF